MTTVPEQGSVVLELGRAATRRVQCVCASLAMLALLTGWTWGQNPVAGPPQRAHAVRGTVSAGGMAVPGATVTAANKTTGAQVTTTTDVTGRYTIELPAPGRYEIGVQMTAFAPVSRDVEATGPAQAVQADFQLILLSRARTDRLQESAARERAMRREVRRGGAGAALDDVVAPGTAAEQLVPQGMQVPGMNANSATESVAISGNTVTSQFAGLSLAEMQQRTREMREDRPGFQQAGRPSGGFSRGEGAGPPMIAGAGGRRGFDSNRVHGSLSYAIGDSSLDAAPYSLTGQPSRKAGYAQHRYSAALGGPLSIPKIYNGGRKTFFFASFNGSRAANPYDAFSTVPTAAERSGNFSNTLTTTGAGKSPVVIINPQTRQPFTGNIIPAAQISAAARGLLSFIPLPNLPGTLQNFHYVTSATNNISNINVRLVHSFNGMATGGSVAAHATTSILVSITRLRPRISPILSPR